MIFIIQAEGVEIRQASENWELESIYRLNYETFVEEIPQHQENNSRILVDRFDHENIYIIALKDHEIIGMLALRDKRPFSLDQKIENLDEFLPEYKKICEVRLLSVRKQFRNTKIIYGLIKQAFHYITLNEYDILVISGILNQQKLYKHIGFIPFGHIVGNDKAQFQPMYITKDSFKLQSLLSDKCQVSFLPGPVELCEEVEKAFASRPLSHRSQTFKNIFYETKRKLCNLVNAKNVEIFTGSGTLANDVISLEIAKLNKKGLILSNGEFGDRLINHGYKNNLDFIPYRIPWGEEVNWDEISKMIKKERIDWVYLVYSETSTGMINDYHSLLPLVDNDNLKICLDAISAIGNIPVDLSRVYLASCVSGKGLASFCGLSMVFYNHIIKKTDDCIPRCLDLYQYANNEGIPYTISSNLVLALNSALKNLNINEKYKRISQLHVFLKESLISIGVLVLNQGSNFNPAVITVPIEKFDTQIIGENLRKQGYWISYESNYLVQRNWIQICLMGDIQKKYIEGLISLIKDNVVENK